MIKPLKKIWINSKFVNWKDAKIHVMTHALHYGTALFEGMRCYKTYDGRSAVFRMRDHYSRMLQGLKSYLFEERYELNYLCKVTRDLVTKNNLKSCYIRPICFAGYGVFGLSLKGVTFDFAIIPIELGNYFGSKKEKGIDLKVSSWQRINSTILSPHIKASANYLNSVLAKREATDDGFDEAVMLTEEGHVSEGSGENIFIVKDGKLYTPPLHDSILAGITRESIINIAREEGIEVKEISLLRDDLYAADEVFLCGTAAEITPVKSIDKRIISNGSPGKMTKELMDTFSNVVNGKDERFSKWLEYVDKRKGV